MNTFSLHFCTVYTVDNAVIYGTSRAILILGVYDVQYIHLDYFTVFELLKWCAHAYMHSIQK